MSQTRPPPGFGPYAFELTEDEARVAAARSGLRRALAGGLTRHFAPLAAFVLAIFFAAILALTGLVGRRAGEIALLLATGAFLIHRLTTLRRFAAARRAGRAEIEALRGAGRLVLSVDETGLGLNGASAPARWNFADCLDAEDAGGLIDLWPRSGSPAVVPTRVFAGAEAAAFVEFLRGRLPRRLALPPCGR